MPTLRTSHKVLITALVVLGLCIAAYVFAAKKLSSKTAEFIESRDALVREQYMQDNEARAKSVLSSTENVRLALMEYFISYNDPLELLSMVDGQLPRLAGVEARVPDGGITKVVSGEQKVKDDSKNEEAPRVRTAINVKGDWQNMYHYLLLLEHMPYATTIDKVTLTRSTTGGDYEWEGDVFLIAASTE